MSDKSNPQSSSLKTIVITVENLAPSQGTALSPLWFGFHDGSFATISQGSPASMAIERLAEDGTTGFLTSAFSGSGAGIVQGTVFGTNDVFNGIFPGSRVTLKVLLDVGRPDSLYLSYAAMVIPSNDAFITNEDPKSHRVVDSYGRFVGAEIVVAGQDVLDAGTEVNDEAPLHAAGAGPIFIFDTGVAEKGVIHKHEGYQPGGTILSIPMWANADFKAPDYQVARITVAEADTTP
jgi:hypothetical protein